MKVLTIIFTLLTTLTFGQSDQTKRYSTDYVISVLRGHKMNLSATTNAIISKIVTAYHNEAQQNELIRFYKETYDYKIVDKNILTKLIDSLSLSGLSEELKSQARETKKSVVFRLLGKEVKEFKFPNKDGTEISLSSLRYKIVIIELWATWCRPCIKEMKKVSKLRQANPNIEFYSISIDKQYDKMKKFVTKNHYEWPIVFGGDQEANKELWDYFNIVAIPKYYIVNRDGIIINAADAIDEEFIKSLR
jgi:peroxiredoxin